MATTVSLRGKTKVKRVIVGRPIKRILSTTGNINNLGGVSTAGKVNGSLLAYNSSTGLWEAVSEINNQELNGGQY